MNKLVRIPETIGLTNLAVPYLLLNIKDHNIYIYTNIKRYGR